MKFVVFDVSTNKPVKTPQFSQQRAAAIRQVPPRADCTLCGNAQCARQNGAIEFVLCPLAAGQGGGWPER